MSVDDFGLADVVGFDDRVGSQSTIAASRMLPRSWHLGVTNPIVVGSVLDRTVHIARRIKLVEGSLGEALRATADETLGSAGV